MIAAIHVAEAYDDSLLPCLFENEFFEERSGWIISIGIEPVFDPIRSDPRFVQLLQKFNFPRNSP